VPTKTVLKVGFLDRDFEPDHLAEKSNRTKMGPKIHCELWSKVPFPFFLLAVPPARPSGCRLDNSTPSATSSTASEAAITNEVPSSGDSLVVYCKAGFDGGLPQTFLLEVRHSGRDLVANQSVTSRPHFRVDGLAPDTAFTLDVYSLNAKGRSTPVRLTARTRKSTGQADVKYSFSAGKL
jgi:hypothetical protein